MPKRYVCEEYGTPYEEGYRKICSIEEHDKQIRAEVIDAILGYISIRMSRLKFLADNDERLNNQYNAHYHRGGLWELGNVRDDLEQLKENK